MGKGKDESQALEALKKAANQFEALAADGVSEGFGDALKRPDESPVNKLKNLAEPIALDRYVRHTIEVVMDRLTLVRGVRRRLEEAIEAAVERTGGTAAFLLPAEGPGGRLPYYGYGAGILRVSLGDNWESGGSNSSSLEAWFYIADATVTAGATTLVENGRLVVR